MSNKVSTPTENRRPTGRIITAVSCMLPVILSSCSMPEKDTSSECSNQPNLIGVIVLSSQQISTIDTNTLQNVAIDPTFANTLTNSHTVLPDVIIAVMNADQAESDADRKMYADAAISIGRDAKVANVQMTTDPNQSVDTMLLTSGTAPCKAEA